MKRYSIITFILLLATSSSLYAKTSGPRIWLGLGAGYSNGGGGAVEISALNLTPSFPLGLHFSVGYFRQDDPGLAVNARQIFINDTTTGNDNILEYGYNIFFRLDFSYPVVQKKRFTLAPFLGVAHVRYLAHFDYQGGNEAFNVTTNPWGVGGGVRFSFQLSKNTMLILNGGLDYFFESQISAHGNFYNPDGVDDNPRDPYVYADADESIKQPVWNPKITLSIAFRL